MKKTILTAAMLLPLLFAGAAEAKKAPVFVPPTYEVALSSVTVPAQCVGMTFAHAFVAPDNTIVNGTTGNDLIFVGMSGEANGLAGNDCIVGGFNAELSGGAGDDTLVSGGNEFIDGGAGSDTAYFNRNSDAVTSIEHKVNSAL